MIEQIRPADVAAWLSQGEGGANAAPVLLDVREPWERQTASVSPEGVTVVAIPMNEIPARLGELDPDQRVACLCHHGGRSQHVAMYLQHQGFTQLANVSGGIDAWSVTLDPQVPRY